MQLNFTIPGRIGGKGRHRTVNWRGKPMQVTPAKTRADEAIVRHFAEQAMKGVARFHGPVALMVRVWITPPISWPKKMRANTKWVTGRPDCDNQLKLIADALNHIVWSDDSQIASINIIRKYTLDRPECVEVAVHMLSEESE